jgi:hypothetical protein
MESQRQGADITALNYVFGAIQARMAARAQAAFLRYAKAIDDGLVNEATTDLAITLVGVLRHELSDRDLSGYLSPESKAQLQELVLDHQNKPAFESPSVLAMARVIEALRSQGEQKGG